MKKFSGRAGSFWQSIPTLAGIIICAASAAIAADMTKPSVTITSPRANARLTEATLTIQGTARDDVGLEEVQYRLNGSDFETATGAANWSATVELVPGTNVFEVKSVDTSANESSLVSRQFFLVVMSPLTVTIDGTGTVTPGLESLEVGKGYSLTAKPGPGNVFSNWTGDVTADTAKLNFIMEPDMVLQANFVPNPFPPTKGSYTGLVKENAGVRFESAGMVTVTITDSGKLTGTLLLAGKRYRWKGQLDLRGRADIMIPRPGAEPLELRLFKDLNDPGDQIEEVLLIDPLWESQGVAERPVFNAATAPCPFAGRYTVILPGPDDEDPLLPGGDGYATLTIDENGRVKMGGVLADGTKFSYSTFVSLLGDWSIYVPLYRSKGLLFDVANFLELDEFAAFLTWIKPALPGKYYPDGFRTDLFARGFLYTPSSPLLPFSDGMAAFRGGNLPESFQNEVTLETNNKVTNEGPQPLTMTVVPATGLFRGTVTPPGATKPLRFSGVLFQEEMDAGGYGFFLGASESGRVRVTALPAAP